ncbi:hypothetical protein BDY21DRAFT_347637 [Lineolata rhizophorae]|uniref:Uncharacterized protein n=1 Tax=Lineolata rhizophorae TaxID=578093 RepID=A0A6A6NYE0_9PEZI|nr:hypothetical protein BDY21DRAFT_347637 [Lineolata rhizophorae]
MGASCSEGKRKTWYRTPLPGRGNCRSSARRVCALRSGLCRVLSRRWLISAPSGPGSRLCPRKEDGERGRQEKGSREKKSTDQPWNTEPGPAHAGHRKRARGSGDGAHGKPSAACASGRARAGGQREAFRVPLMLVSRPVASRPGWLAAATAASRAPALGLSCLTNSST